MTRWLLFVFFTIFCTILRRGESLCCQHCKAIGDDDCSGESIECENEDDVCTKAVEYSINNGVVRSAAYRGCWNLLVVCNHVLTINTTGYQLIIYYDCCDNESRCNSGPIVVPPVNITENGLYCKSCSVEGSYECSGYVPLACRGDQGDCLEFHGNATFPGDGEKKHSFAGCAKTGACLVGYADLVGTKIGEYNNLTCPESNRIYFND